MLNLLKMNRKGDDKIVKSVEAEFFVHKAEVSVLHEIIDHQLYTNEKLAQLLHAGLGSELASLKLLINNHLPEDQEFTKRLISQLDFLIKEVGTYSSILKKETHGLCLLNQKVTNLLEAVSLKTNLVVTYNSYGLDEPLMEPKVGILYTCVKNLVIYSLQNEHASKADLSINHHSQEFVNLLYEDHAVRMGLKPLKDETWVKDIRKEVVRLGGELHIGMNGGRSTEFVLNIPCTDSENYIV
jgi:signal transduction histidine kinase